MAAGEKPGVSPGFLLEESPDSAARWLPVPVAGGRKLAPAARRGGAIRRMRTGPSPVPSSYKRAIETSPAGNGGSGTW